MVSVATGSCSLLQRGELSVKLSWMVNSRQSTSQLLVLKDFWPIHLSERRILYSERLLILNKLRKGELFEIMLPWTTTKPRHAGLSLNKWRYWGHSLKFVMQRARRDTPDERRRGLQPRRGLWLIAWRFTATQENWGRKNYISSKRYLMNVVLLRLQLGRPTDN